MRGFCIQRDWVVWGWLAVFALLAGGCSKLENSVFGTDKVRPYKGGMSAAATQQASQPARSSADGAGDRGEAPVAEEQAWATGEVSVTGEEALAEAEEREEEAQEVVAPILLEEPYSLNTLNIVRLVYQASPSVTASREEKEAAKHQLEEFKTNLSRFEPFVEVKGEASKFPNRRDAKGRFGEVVGGVEKETFEGAVIRMEGGASASHVKFGQTEEDQDEQESGSGAVVRARVEVPFIGSRRRQNRVISQAYQESTARKAELNYLRDYRRDVINALSYYHSGLLYLNYVRAYEQKIFELEKLLNDRRTPAEGMGRLESTMGSAEVSRDNYQMYYDQAVTSLVAALGIGLGAEFTVAEPAYAPSPYIKRRRRPRAGRTCWRGRTIIIRNFGC